MAYNDEHDALGILEQRASAEPYIPGEEEQQLLTDLSVRFQEAARHRLAWERQWEINWLYQRGEQPVRNLTTGDVFRLPQDDNSRLVSGDNVIRPVARSLLGKLTRAIPTCVVVPPTSDLQDLQGSIVADSLLYYLRRKEKLDIKYIDTYRNVITFGTGFLKLSWDRQGGQLRAHCPECNYTGDGQDVDQDCPMCKEELEGQATEQHQLMQQQMSTEAEALGESLGEMPQLELPEVPKLEGQQEGDIRIDVLDPREVFIDPSAVTLQEAQWWCHRVALPVAKIRSMFPKHAKHIDKEGSITTDQYVTMVRGTTTYRAASRQLEDHAYLFEFHEKPTEDYPQGRIIWKTQGIILEQVENPYQQLGRFPLYAFFWERNAGEFYGESFIEQSASIQRELNILLTQLREHRELTNNPQWWVPFNAGIAIEEMDTVAGRIHKYNPMSKPPSTTPLPPFANYVYSEIDRMKGAIRGQASVTEQEVGITQSEASGRYAAIIEAESNQQVGPVLKYNASEWIELHRGIFQLAQENYDDERTWTVFGHDMPKTYSAAAIKRLNPMTDIDIQEEDSLSKNAAVRQNQVIELATRVPWLFTGKDGQPDKKAFMRMAGIKMPGVVPETKSADHAWAANIPELLKTGQGYQPQNWDEPEAFAEELEAWLKGPGRNEDPQLVEQVNQMYTFYLQRTQAYLQQQQASQASQAGQPGQAGGQASSQGQAQQRAGASPPSAQPQQTSASQISQQADQSAETTARTQVAHEG